MKILILDGVKKENSFFKNTVSRLKNFLDKKGFNVSALELPNLYLKPCKGCFDCWLKTPGLCSIKNDIAHSMLKKIIESDIIVFLTTIKFGSFSLYLKKAIDRFVPLANPYFRKINDITQHIPRYKKEFKIIALGIQENVDSESEQIFRRLIARNAVNFFNSIYSANVLNASNKEDIESIADRSLKEIGIND